MENSTKKATPRPWKLDSMNISGRVITDKLGEEIADVVDSDDASLIVKAVNNHDALLAIAKHIEIFADDLLLNKCSEWSIIVEEAQQAIANSKATK